MAYAERIEFESATLFKELVDNVCNCSTTFTGFFSRYGYVFMSDLGVKNLKCRTVKGCQW